jgi:RecA-family ATPase
MVRIAFGNSRGSPPLPEIARQYLSRGWMPIPLHARSKRPNAGTGWQHWRCDAEDVDEKFSDQEGNIGVLLGDASGGLIDIDIDNEVSLALAAHFLPPTALRFGRASTPEAHWLYICPEVRTEKYTNPLKGDDQKEPLVEIRSSGVQTVFPGSIHQDTGERIRWASEGDPAVVDADALRRAVGRLSAASLLVQVWNESLSRDELAACMVGMLRRGEWDEKAIGDFIGPTAKAAHDEEWKVRVRKARASSRHEYGWPKLLAILGQALGALKARVVADRLKAWLDLKREDEPDGWVDVLAGPEKSRPTRQELTGEPYEPPVLVERYLLRDAEGFVGPGETGKTTVILYEDVHLILGRPLYGRKIVQSGHTLLVTAEDTRQIALSRLNWICRGLGLTDAEIDTVLAGFHVEDLSAELVRLATADRTGNVKATGLLDEIIRKYRGAGLVSITLDPTSHLGPGETSGNDGMSAFMRIARYLSNALQCAVRVIHHVSQNVARGGITDQFAGRGGTAFADNSRNNHQLIKATSRSFGYQGADYNIPLEVRDEAIAAGEVLVIFVHKISYVKRDPTPIVLWRNGFMFHHWDAERVDNTPAAREERETELIDTIVEFIREKSAKNVRVTKNELGRTYLDALKRSSRGASREGVHAAIDATIGAGRLENAPLPKSDVQGKKSTYLRIVGDAS